MGWVASLFRAMASASYWWCVGWVLYVVVGGDPVPLHHERGLVEEYGPVALVLTVAVVLYAFLLRVERGRR